MTLPDCPYCKWEYTTNEHICFATHSLSLDDFAWIPMCKVVLGSELCPEGWR